MTIEQIGTTIGIIMITTAYTIFILLVQKYVGIWRRARKIARKRKGGK